MATAKKPTTKKTAAKKPAVAQKTTVKRQSVSKPVVKKTATAKKTIAPKSVKQSKLESFRISKERYPFMTFKITDQTIYWSILLIYVMLLVLWISNIQLETLQIIESIKVIQ